MSTELALFAVAKEALAEAVKVDEVKGVRDHAERIRLYGQQANDRTIIADATEIIMRAERRLGELLRSAHQTGQLGIGRPSRSNVEEGEEAPAVEEAETVEVVRPQRVTLKEAGISKKLSTRSQKFAAVAETAFEAALLSAREKILAGGAVVVNPLKDLSTAEKKSRRRAREIELGAKQMALPEARFGVILADPEWKFETYSEETGMDRSADNHYPTSSLEAIKSRDVGSLAADDSICWLWATVPMLLEGIEVLKAWGFEYKSHLIWNKDRVGTGYWFRNKHELLLIGTRGRIPAPAMGEQFPSVIDAPVGEHSAKPAIFYEIIEAYFPTLPKIELNARTARPGWVRWGYEAPKENTPEGSGTAREASGGQPLPCDGDIGDLKQGTQSAPHPLSRDEADALIREGDADKTPLAVLVERTGLTLNQVKDRRRVLGLSSRDRQREAVAAANRRRASEAAS
jgi:N6-adenosine-specific RNA methylase IME4